MKIYLAGDVPKGKEEEEKFVDWRTKYMDVLNKSLDADYIDPYDRSLDESNFLAVFGTDCSHIKSCSLVIINAENKLGVGTAQEMVIAKYFKKPVITVLPKNSYHRRSNIVINGKKIKDWIHPFIFSFSDFIIQNIFEIEKIKEKLQNSKIKDISIIDESIKYINSL